MLVCPALLAGEKRAVDFDAPLRPAPWGELNVLHAALGGLATLAGRVAVLPALNCSGVSDAFLQPGTLPNRCFWHVHRSPSRGAAWADGAVRCVFRLGSCAEDAVAPPTELDEALRASSSATPPLVELPLDSADSAATAAAAVRDLSSERLRDARVVRVRLRLPPRAAPSGGGASLEQLARPSACEGVHGLLEAAGHAEWAAAVQRFCRVCPELTDRDKKRKRECTNQC